MLTAVLRPAELSAEGSLDENHQYLWREPIELPAELRRAVGLVAGLPVVLPAELRATELPEPTVVDAWELRRGCLGSPGFQSQSMNCALLSGLSWRGSAEFERGGRGAGKFERGRRCSTELGRTSNELGVGSAELSREAAGLQSQSIILSRCGLWLGLSGGLGEMCCGSAELRCGSAELRI
mmetsp:Transcript_5322/g.9458  ORF Transcript_5322/g.9458 Transcript_5322/m.9458 type:complete len:181 (+) Transcript_5322:368-910(+)